MQVLFTKHSGKYNVNLSVYAPLVRHSNRAQQSSLRNSTTDPVRIEEDKLNTSSVKI